MENAIARCSSIANVQLVPDQWLPRQLSPSLFTDHATTGCRISPGWVESSCPGHVPSQLPVSLKPLTGGAAQEAEKALILCQTCSAVTETSLCYQHYPHIKFKHNTVPAAWKKISPVPTKTRPNSSYSLFVYI